MFGMKISIPHTYSLIFLILIFMALLTWLLPSGQFETQEREFPGGITKSVVIPGSYHGVPKVDENGADLRQGFFGILMAPAKGMADAAQIIAFVFLVGGVFSIIMRTGAIDAALSIAFQKLRGKEKIIIPFTMLLFGIGGSTVGTSEETIPFYLVFIPFMMAFGYDSLTGMMTVYLGTLAGYTASTINPFSVLIAQGIAGVMGNPQLWFRCIQWAIFMSVAITFVMQYARKVKKDPEKSLAYQSDLNNKEYFMVNVNDLKDVKFTVRHKIILIGFTVGIAYMVWGLLKKSFYMDEISGVFLGIGLFAGVVGGLSEKEMATAFVNGCKEFAFAGVLIGLASGILIVAENGMIIDTILNSLASGLNGLPMAASTTLMLVVQSVIAFFVPSSSCQAALTMPVMAPLGDLIGVNREAVVTAFQYGNGITAMISPTGGVLMAALSISKIGWDIWLKSVMKLVFVFFGLSVIFCAISAYLPA